jgi:hypothetical protein
MSSKKISLCRKKSPECISHRSKKVSVQISWGKKSMPWGKYPPGETISRVNILSREAFSKLNYPGKYIHCG